MNTICLICIKPHKIWCDFLNNFKKYKIFVIIDDNNFDITFFKNAYTNISFVQINEEKCKNYFYINMNFIVFYKEITGWEKALYYFSVENLNNNFIWFMEDDVFFYDENTIKNIDKKYMYDDLLSNNYEINEIGDKKDWLWNRININISPPYYKGMMCCVRLSNKILKCIYDYANKNKTLFFLEALFPTIAFKNNLIYSTPTEFIEIHYRKDFNIEEINKKILYHPVKNLEQHITFRT